MQDSTVLHRQGLELLERLHGGHAGEAIVNEMKDICPFFAEMTSKAVTGQKGLEMHFEQLEFFNSSTITAIIQYVKELRDRKVKLTVSFDARHRWQKIFFDALCIFDKGDGLFTIQSAPVTSAG